jgi:hypothetical protein
LLPHWLLPLPTPGFLVLLAISGLLYEVTCYGALPAGGAVLGPFNYSKVVNCLLLVGVCTLFSRGLVQSSAGYSNRLYTVYVCHLLPFGRALE